MKIKCTYCGGTLIIDENNYEPGETISVECRRCGESNEILIPGAEISVDSEKNDSEKNKEEVITSVSSNSIKENKEEEDVKNIEAENKEKKTAEEKVTEVKKEENSDQNKAKNRKAKAESPAGEKTPACEKKRRSVKEKEDSGETSSTASEATPKPKVKRKSPAKKPTIQPPVNNIPNNGSKNQGCSSGGCLVFILILGVTLSCIWGLRKCGGSGSDAACDTDLAVEAVELEVEEPELYAVVDTAYVDSAMFDSSVTEEVPTAEEEDTSGSASYKMGFHSGKNSFDGDMIHTDGRRFPFTLEFYYYPGENRIDNITYVNSSSGTRVKMETMEFTSSFVKFEGRDGGKPFILQFSDTHPYSGDAWWGNFHQDIELNYR
ncbi:MAG: hypothetical protein K2G53_09310 [Muribaculaceae bacterium]|nr:hypothetical protein [Muribaculaceae bacterium]